MVQSQNMRAMAGAAGTTNKPYSDQSLSGEIGGGKSNIVFSKSVQNAYSQKEGKGALVNHNALISRFHNYVN